MVLITGGSGYIGRHLVGEGDVLVGNDVVVDNLEGGGKPRGKFYYCDIRDRQALERVFRENDIEYVIHLAGVVECEDVRKVVDVNVVGSMNVFEMAAKYKVKRVVYASSSAVKGESIYGRSKSMMEDISKFYDVECIGLRYHNVYGSGGKGTGHGVIDTWDDRAYRGLPCIVEGGKQTRDFIHIDDVVDVTKRALTMEFIEPIFDVGTGIETSINSLAKEFRILHFDIKIEYTEGRKDEILRSYADTTIMKTLLPKPKPLVEGLF